MQNEHLNQINHGYPKSFELETISKGESLDCAEF